MQLPSTCAHRQEVKENKSKIENGNVCSIQALQDAGKVVNSDHPCGILPVGQNLILILDHVGMFLRYKICLPHLITWGDSYKIFTDSRDCKGVQETLFDHFAPSK